MPLFVCDKCNAIENTALGFYHLRNRAVKLFGEDSGVKDGEALCSQCMPNKFGDGTEHKRGGKWHGRFDREFYDPENKKDIYLNR